MCKSGCGRAMHGIGDDLASGFCNRTCRASFFASFGVDVPKKGESWPKSIIDAM
jgi:hypothetical protein